VCYQVPLPIAERLLSEPQTDKKDFSELRTARRISVTRKGVLTSEDDPLALTALAQQYTCLIQDMSQTGFLLLTTEKFWTGQILGFRCELLPERVLECKVEVVHVGDSVVGAKIVEIDNEGAEICKAFLRDQFSTSRANDIARASAARKKQGEPSAITQNKRARSWFTRKG
jgi:hypothetical protein